MKAAIFIGLKRMQALQNDTSNKAFYSELWTSLQVVFQNRFLKRDYLKKRQFYLLERLALREDTKILQSHFLMVFDGSLSSPLDFFLFFFTGFLYF
jgi:hypothetical protein